MRGSRAVAELLLRAGAEPSGTASARAAAAAHAAAAAAGRPAAAAAAAELLALAPPLVIAVARADVGLARLLLEAGGEPDDLRDAR